MAGWLLSFFFSLCVAVESACPSDSASVQARKSFPLTNLSHRIAVFPRSRSIVQHPATIHCYIFFHCIKKILQLQSDAAAAVPSQRSLLWR